MKNIKSIISIISVISILILTFNVLLVQAAPSSITLVLSGEGSAEVTAYTGKGKAIDFGSYASPDNVKLTGNVDYVVFTLIPQTDPLDPYHVSSIVQDGNYIPFGDDNLVDLGDGTYNYTLNMELKQHIIEVTFSKEGIAIIPANTAATVFLGSTASLTVDNSQNDEPIKFTGSIPKFANQDSYTILMWEITTDSIYETVQITMRITMDDPTKDPIDKIFIWRTDLEYPNADVYPIGEPDNVINGNDVNTVAKINPGTAIGDPNWEEVKIFDINGNDVIDNEDVNIVSNYNPMGEVWQQLETTWEQIGVDEWLVKAETDSFSIFRCR